ncbi:hypothetical protein TNCV_1042261 [Trichonephila clavipes]|nr:hypothetical protein TNCV_1042261 [Trichonephila clavipes]
MRPWAEFCGLRMISDEGHVVDPPLLFKKILFRRKGEGDGKKKKKCRERERGAGLGERKGLSPRLEWKDDECEGR